MATPFKTGFVPTTDALSNEKVTDSSGVERTVYDSDAYLYQRGTKITNTAAEINNISRAVTAASTGTNIANYKRVNFGSTSAAQTFTLDVPTLGATVDLICTGVVASTTPHKVYAGASATFDGTNHNVAFGAIGNVLSLVGVSSTLWAYNANSTSTIVFST
jgi:hypothetical protein